METYSPCYFIMSPRYPKSNYSEENYEKTSRFPSRLGRVKEKFHDRYVYIVRSRYVAPIYIYILYKYETKTVEVLTVVLLN